MAMAGGAGATFTLTNTGPTPSLVVSKTHVGAFTRGGTGEWDITVSNAPGSIATVGTTTLSDVLPAGYTVNSFPSLPLPGVSCSPPGTTTATCIFTIALAGGSSFPVIKMIVNVPANSPPTVTNTAKAFGGGDPVHTTLATAATGSDTVAIGQAAAAITATAGTPQTTPINTVFPINLQASVR